MQVCASLLSSPGPSQGHVASPDELAAFERRAELRHWLQKKSDISAFLSSPVPPALRLIAGVRCASTKPGAEPRALFHLMSSPLSSGEQREQSFALGVGVKKWVGGQREAAESTLPDVFWLIFEGFLKHNSHTADHLITRK